MTKHEWKNLPMQTRREFLRLGAAGALGFALPHAFAKPAGARAWTLIETSRDGARLSPGTIPGNAASGATLSCNSAKRFQEAIPPLESYEKLAPDSPTGHFQLALAYSGVGRKDDANREAALQRETADSLEKVRRRVAEGLLQKQDSQGNSGGDPAK